MEAVIQARDLVKRYRDGTEAVRGISFDVQRGEIFGLLGPNGAGKTTTMHMLGTLHSITSGDARVLGHDVAGSPWAIRRRMGFAMQEVGMDDLATAWEMMIFHAGLYGIKGAKAKRRAEELLHEFDLWKHRDRRVTRFSGGMQRRLDLAVSLIHEPDVLFLDEPSTGLDPTSRGELWGILRRLRTQRGLTILMSTHYMEEADKLCDRIAIVNDGKIVAIDTPRNLKRSLGGHAIHVHASSPLSLAEAEALEARFSGKAHVKGDHIMVRVQDGGESLLPVLMRIHETGIQVADTSVHAPTLDDVFQRYTGERLEEAV